ncbi:hypothetical protein ADUPG1_007188, partial [Aduncisulcus paluster]
WQVECWVGYYFDVESSSCLLALTDSAAAICRWCEHESSQSYRCIKEDGASDVSAVCRNGLSGPKCTVRTCPSNPDGVICGSGGTCDLVSNTCICDASSMLVSGYCVDTPYKVFIEDIDVRKNICEATGHGAVICDVDIFEFAELTQLEIGSGDTLADINSIVGIENLYQLGSLSIYESGLTDINSIYDLPMLNYIGFYGSNPNFYDLSPIKGLFYLSTILTIGKSGLFDFSPLYQHTSLSTLVFGDNIFSNCHAEDSTELESFYNGVFPHLDSFPDPSTCFYSNVCTSDDESICPYVSLNEVYNPHLDIIQCSNIALKVELDGDEGFVCHSIHDEYIRTYLGESAALTPADNGVFTIPTLRTTLAEVDLSSISTDITTLNGLEFMTGIQILSLSGYDLGKEDYYAENKVQDRRTLQFLTSMNTLDELSLVSCGIKAFEDIFEMSNRIFTGKFEMPIKKLSLQDNMISDLSGLLRYKFLNGIDIAIDANYICDIDKFVDYLTSQTNFDSYSFVYSTQTCMCDDESTLTDNRMVCREIYEDYWNKECWQGWALVDGDCVELETDVDYSRANICEKQNMIPIRETLDSEVQCACRSGYLGDDCSEVTCPLDSDNVRCGKGSCVEGTCSCMTHAELNSDGVCQCLSGYYGDSCDSLCPYADGKVCSGSDHGTCSADTCICLDAYFGNACQYVKIPDDNLRYALCNLFQGHDAECNDILQSELENVGELDLSSVDIVSLRGVEFMVNLTSIDLSNNFNLEDISELSTLSELHSINISSSAIPSLSQISSLYTQIDTVLMSDSLVDVYEVLHFQNEYNDLITLDISYNSVDSLDLLAQLSALSDLNVSHNSIFDPFPIMNYLDSLETLDISYNLICGASSITDFQGLNSFISEENECVCSDTFSYVEGVICAEIWEGEWQFVCSDGFYEDLTTSQTIQCNPLSISNSMYDSCFGLLPLHERCVFSGDTTEIRCLDGWFGPDCDLECALDPEDSSSGMCGVYSASIDSHGECNLSTHECECAPKYKGSSCEYIVFEDEELCWEMFDIVYPSMDRPSECAVSPLDMTKVTSLDLSGSDIVEGFEEFQFITSEITTIDLSNSSLLRSIDGIAHLTHLETVNMTGCQNLDNMSPLRDLPSLKYLNISESNVNDIESALQPFVASLIDLNIGSCQNLSAVSIEFLSAFSALQYLDISNIYFDKVPDLCASQNSLLSLNMSYNGIESLDSISCLASSLNILDISWNSIVDLDILLDFTQLFSLDVSYNYVYNLFPLYSLSFYSLILTSNRILDLVPLYSNSQSVILMELSSNYLTVDLRATDIEDIFSSASSYLSSSVDIGTQRSLVALSTGDSCPNPVTEREICRVIGIDSESEELIVDLGCSGDSVRIVGEFGITCEEFPDGMDNNLSISCLNPRYDCISTYNNSEMIQLKCADRWYGDDCSESCPYDTSGQICGGFDCNISSHSCECPSGYTGSLCSFEEQYVSSIADISEEMLLVLCEAKNRVACIGDSENLLSQLLVSDLGLISELTIPAEVTSLEGIQYCEMLESLSFETESALEDFSLVASLSNLISLSMPEGTTTDNISTIVDVVEIMVTEAGNNISSFSSSICVGLCSLQALYISNSPAIAPSSTDERDFLTLLNYLSKCVGSCPSGPFSLADTLQKVVLSNNGLTDPSFIYIQPSFSNLVFLDLSGNDFSDISFIGAMILELDELLFLYLDDNHFCSLSDCTELLNDIDISVSNRVLAMSELSIASQTVMLCDESICDTESNEICVVIDSQEYCDCRGDSFLSSESDSCEFVEDRLDCLGCGASRGTCVEGTDDTVSCVCHDGWYGEECASACPMVESNGSSLVCGGNTHGYCEITEHVCVCKNSFMGPACQLYCESQVQCSSHGLCTVVYDLDDLTPLSGCECDDGWYGSDCSSLYPVETIISSGESNDFVCGKDYSSSNNGDYSQYINEETYTCDCASHGLALDSTLGTCIDPATHPLYSSIVGNSFACVGCGQDNSNGSCVIDESSSAAMCKCAYGWNTSENEISIPCSLDVCGVSQSTVTICSGHGFCGYDEQSAGYLCICEDEWLGTQCSEELNHRIGLIIFLIFVMLICIGVGVIGIILFYRQKKENTGLNDGKETRANHPCSVQSTIVPPHPLETGPSRSIYPVQLSKTLIPPGEMQDYPPTQSDMVEDASNPLPMYSQSENAFSLPMKEEKIAIDTRVVEEEKHQIVDNPPSYFKSTFQAKPDVDPTLDEFAYIPMGEYGASQSSTIQSSAVEDRIDGYCEDTVVVPDDTYHGESVRSIPQLPQDISSTLGSDGDPIASIITRKK